MFQTTLVGQDGATVILDILASFEYNGTKWRNVVHLFLCLLGSQIKVVQKIVQGTTCAELKNENDEGSRGELSMYHAVERAIRNYGRTPTCVARHVINFNATLIIQNQMHI